jgi:hypothetical protein
MPDPTVAVARAHPERRVHPETTWAVVSSGVVLVRRDIGQTLALGYPEAALWDFVVRDIPMDRVRQMVAALTNTGAEDSAWIGRTLRLWSEQGWVLDAECHG